MFVTACVVFNADKLAFITYPTDQMGRKCTQDNPAFNYLYFASSNDPVTIKSCRRNDFASASARKAPRTGWSACQLIVLVAPKTRTLISRCKYIRRQRRKQQSGCIAFQQMNPSKNKYFRTPTYKNVLTSLNRIDLSGFQLEWHLDSACSSCCSTAVSHARWSTSQSFWAGFASLVLLPFSFTGIPRNMTSIVGTSIIIVLSYSCWLPYFLFLESCSSALCALNRLISNSAEST